MFSTFCSNVDFPLLKTKLKSFFRPELISKWRPRQASTTELEEIVPPMKVINDTPCKQLFSHTLLSGKFLFVAKFGQMYHINGFFYDGKVCLESSKSMICLCALKVLSMESIITSRVFQIIIIFWCKSLTFKKGWVLNMVIVTKLIYKPNSVP